MKQLLIGVGYLILASVGWAAEAKFAAKPEAVKSKDKVQITFAVAASTDVEVSIVDEAGKVVRHLAAGVLGGEKDPPPPLKPGLEQKLDWDLKDDRGAAVPDGALKVRVRIGTGVKFGRYIGADPYNVGKVLSSGVDEDGNIYVLAFQGQLNQGQMNLRVFDKDGNYLREIVPFQADVPADEMGKLASWDEKAGTFRVRNYSNLNPDFYGGTGKGKARTLDMVSISIKDGVALKGQRSYLIKASNGALLGYNVSGVAPLKPADMGKLAPKLGARGELPNDWGRLAVDVDRDEIYVNDQCSRFWRFDGKTGTGALLAKDKRVFGATDLAVGYDGLLYVRTARGAADGCDYSGPFGRYTRDLEPAPYAESGTHILSKYIYSRYGVGYAERGIGVGPDGKAYISFMYDWVKYCVAGFGADGKPMAGEYLKDVVPGKGEYPAGLNSAIIGPLPQAHGGIRVDWQGNIYVGMLFHPVGFKVPEGQDKMVWQYMVGGVVKFPPTGGYVEGEPAMMRGTVAKNMQAYYCGLGPLSSAGFTSNPCCVCRAARFDLDRWGRLAIPNAVANNVRLYDNAGNLVLEFGKYGNFDSLYINPNTDKGRNGKPTVAADDIPLGWPTGAGFGPDKIYVLDTYNRRLAQADLTWQAEGSVDIIR